MNTLRQAIDAYRDKNKNLNGTYVAMAATLLFLYFCPQKDSSCGSK